MVLEILPYSLTVCKVSHVRDINLEAGFFFVGRTDSEISLVCKTEDIPPGATERVDGWKGFRVRGTLDFSLVGILSDLSGILASKGIGLFAVSTYDTDYILVREGDFVRAAEAFTDAGHEIGA